MKYLLAPLLFLFCFAVSAQYSQKTELNDLVASINTFNERQAREKLYLHTDRSVYAAGDTLWFKAYLMEAAYFSPAVKSGLMYVEIANDSNKLVKRMMLPVIAGLSFGQLVLDPAEVPPGSYILRGYTSWMRNFGEGTLFKKPFYVGSSTGTDWLVKYNAGLLKESGKDNLELSIKFNRMDKVHAALKDVQVLALDGKKILARTKMQTDIDGMLKLKFGLPEKLNTPYVSISIQELSKGAENHQLNFPVSLNRLEYTDLQFMPEGGHLIADMPIKVAFKAINEDGSGASVSGKIYNSKGQEITDFSSRYKGMGSFSFSPQATETYSAKINFSNGTSRLYPLPAVKTSGTMLSINNYFDRDSFEVLVKASPDIAAQGNRYFLVGLARGIPCYSALISIKGNGGRLLIDKKMFPTGIVNFTLAAPDKTLLNERIIFVDRNDNLNISLDASKKAYHQRDSVALHIKVTDHNGAPVQGNFSMAVTDDNQVKTDSAGGSILSGMLLTSDLKGNVEAPGYYFSGQMTEKKWTDLDYLLLTQGWVGYDWTDIFKPGKPFEHEAEAEFLIKGKVTNAFNKPVANSGINLLSKKPLIIMDTLTNEQGLFAFNGLFPVDTAVFFIQARNKKGKSFNVGIEMEEFKPPVFKATQQQITPWYVNMDTGRLSTVNKQFQLNKGVDRIMGRNVLKEIKITAKKVVKSSKNLNGPGEADIIIGEEELQKSGQMSLEDLLYKRVSGFGTRTSKSGVRYYCIKNMVLHLIIDGIDIQFFQSEGLSPYDYFKQYFDYYDASEIKGIEVMMTGKYQMRYTSEYVKNPMATPWDHTFIEVTTYGGKGPFLKKTVGTHLYRPMAFTLPKHFYTPKYKPATKADMTDIRSTIHWQPDIATDKNGEATVSFYTADNPATYSIIMEGSDLKGSFGTTRTSIKVQ